ncbi:CBBY-like protein [Prosopis cineraria]|uniref:CBBY-like protein n=1 Tax=Prosopis cineraria TaxID=364024 RepID=UPI00240EF991|nr:CBBY-like protein [Prosopis cineraria]XP_054800833.1 CBBY-like protein [Prosopis cineraria]XP_054800834.1 CBBY-like protein [Prosopis cineraria]
MERASCPVLHTLSVPRIFNKDNRCFLGASTSNFPLLPQYSFTTLPPYSNFPGKVVRSTRLITSCSPSRPHYQDSSQELAVLLEVDGVLMDAYRVGNRQAFNKAFHNLGLDCANWTEPVYLDLVRRSASDEEKMLFLYFNRIGWPTSLPTSEKGKFVKSVLQKKEKALEEFVMSKNLPLRPGVDQFIDDAYNEGIPLVVITACRKSGNDIARAIIEKLGDQSSKVMIVGDKEVEESMYGRLISRNLLSSGLDEQLSKEAKRAVSAEKQRIAKEVASMLKLSVEIDTTLSESLEKIVAAIRAGAEYAGLPVCNCVLVAGSKSGVAGAEVVGMPCVVLRSSLTSRAEFPSANAIFDGFGGGDLTISRLRSLSEKEKPRS